MTPLGFRASVRSARGAWYIDPYYVGRDRGVYASYYGRDAKNTNGAFVEPDSGSAGLSLDESRPSSTGEELRTYRLALITDPGYSTYHGGPQFVTAAKVALVNRVTQIYEDDLTIRLQLIANNDLLNLNDYGTAVAPNGPCGSAGCFTQAQVTGCSSTTRARYVIGQIIGASNYDIGHLALGQPGGGVANLGVVGRSNKAGGCTGVPTPVGDFFAVDYVAHEMGHQFSGNHTFNGNQLNCSGGNRSGPTSVEPGSGQSIMAYAGICLTDDEQPHSDGYFSQRSQQEITSLRLLEPVADQRGADGLASPLRRGQRGPGRHVRTRLRAGRRHRPPERQHQPAAELDVPRGCRGERQYRHDRDRVAALPPGRRRRHDHRSRQCGLQRHRSRSQPSRPRGRSSTRTR